MDAERFDRLTRQVASRTNRRSVFRSVAGGALALAGVGVARRGAAANGGYDGAECASSADCQDGLICEGSSTGILGGALADAPYGPPGVDLPVLTGTTGRCRYRGGDNCAKVGQACQRTSDCCSGLGLSCHNKTCKR